MNTIKYILGRRSLTLLLVVLCWSLCGYLMLRSTQVRTNIISLPDLCRLIFGTSCDKALSSSIAWHLGYPLSSWGLVYFGLLGLLVSIRELLTDRLATLLAALGAGVSIILGVLIIDGHIACPLCLVIHLANILILISLASNTPGVRTAALFTFQKQASPPYTLVQWAALVLVTLFVGGISEIGILQKSLNRQPAVDLDEVAQNFQTAKVEAIPISANRSVLGSARAPVQVVVFSSFQCPACKTLAPSLAHIYKKFGNSIGISFRNFPLSSACNMALSEDMQPRSCEAAFATVAAEQQNRFWNYHDHLFETSLEQNDKTLTSIAKNIGLDIDKWNRDRNSEEVKKIIADDLAIAYKLGINATPTVFINGRRVNSFQESVLTFIIKNELKK
ncbi:thioredoxin domain-containing protein [Nibrella viscosa]